jgi:hypothetical protein
LDAVRMSAMPAFRIPDIPIWPPSRLAGYGAGEGKNVA